MYEISEIYKGMDLELLVGQPIDPCELNDDMFDRLLDQIFLNGIDNLFFEFTMSV
jgi:hypothetical protein